MVVGESGRSGGAARSRGTDAATQAATAELERLFDLSLELLCIAGTDGYFKRVNPAFERLLGYSTETLLTKPFLDFIHPDDVEDTRREIQRLSEGVPTVYFENRYVRRDGSVCWLAWSCAPDTKAGLLYAAARDVSQQKQAEHAQEVYRRRLRSLASELLLVEERERHRLAVDLHDGLDQLITLVRMRLTEIRQAPGPPAPEALAELEQLVDQANQSARSLTFQLSPPLLHDLGLEPAVQWLAEDLERQYGLQIELDDDGEPKIAGERLRFIFFRSIRELLVNVFKHARTKRAVVRLRRDGALLRVDVEDDGVGFDVQSVQASASYGLFSIRERLTSLGGAMIVESAPGEGTRVALMAPLPGPQDDEGSDAESDADGVRESAP